MDDISIADKCIEFIKKYRFAILILLLGMVLMMIPAKEESENTTSSLQTTDQTEPSPQEQLEAILSQIQGAGKVQLYLSVAVGEKIIYQTDEDISTDADSSDIQRDTVIITDADRAQQGLITQINPPTYAGAIVVCQGADKASVRLAIVEAVASVTGLGTDHIVVLKMK